MNSKVSSRSLKKYTANLEMRKSDSGDIEIPKETDEPKQRRRGRPSRFKNNASDEVSSEDEVKVKPIKSPKKRRGRPKLTEVVKNKVASADDKNEGNSKAATSKRKGKAPKTESSGYEENCDPTAQTDQSTQDKDQNEVPKKKRRKQTKAKESMNEDLNSKTSTPKPENEYENEDMNGLIAKTDQPKQDITQNEVPKKKRGRKPKVKTTDDNLNTKASKAKHEYEKGEIFAKTDQPKQGMTLNGVPKKKPGRKPKVKSEIFAKTNQSEKNNTQNEVLKKKRGRKPKVKTTDDNLNSKASKAKHEYEKGEIFAKTDQPKQGMTLNGVPKKKPGRKPKVKTTDDNLNSKASKSELFAKTAQPKLNNIQNGVPKKKRGRKPKVKNTTDDDLNSKMSMTNKETESEEKDETDKDYTQNEAPKKKRRKKANVKEKTDDDLNSKATMFKTKKEKKDELTAKTDQSENITSQEYSPDEDQYAELPTIQEIQDREDGLAGILREDQFCNWNLRHGSNSAIVLKVLQSLCWGQLPHVVKEETPLLRPHDEVKGGPPPRFYGLVRYKHSVKKFAIECPQLLVFKREDNMFLLPPSVKSRGESVLLRVNMDELVAGQLYVYVLRLLYGKLEVDRLHKQFKTSASCIKETMASFRETGKTDDQNRA